MLADPEAELKSAFVYCFFLPVFPLFNFPCGQSYDDDGFKRQQHDLCPGFVSSLLVRSTLSGSMVTAGTDLPSLQR